MKDLSQKAENQVLYVTDLSREGSGVARTADGQVVFIPFSAPGDQVRARWTPSVQRYVHAELLEVLTASDVRQKPPCVLFGKCGGCQWQHLPYSLQWETKVKGFKETLKRKKIQFGEVDLIPAERIWEYRNRVQLRGIGNQLGFFQTGSNSLVNAQRCEIARPEINAVWEQVRSEGRLLGKEYKVEVEVTVKGEVMRTWNAHHSALGFRQVHDGQNEKLRQWIYNALHNAEVLFDLYGGAGNLSFLLANKMKEIHCVDQISSAVDISSRVKEILAFHHSAVLPWVKKRVQEKRIQKNPCAAILDPPREGMGKEASSIVASLEALNVKEAVLVGCDSDAWARDLSLWIARGWKLKKLLAIDLFPQTSHIESVALIAL